MKRVFVSTVLVVFLCSLLIGLFGCSTAQQGETVAEGHRRHIRNLRLSRQQMMEDIDSAFFMDEPSSLTNKAIP
jgi:hypothetical protein